MSRHVSQCAFLSMLLAVLAATVVQADEPPGSIGLKVENLRLAGVDGKLLSLHDLKNHDAIVVVFLSFECPVSNSYVPKLNELARTYGSKKVAVLAVAPSADPADVLKRQAKEFDLAFPLYRDAKLEAARALGAKTVPEAFILDRNFLVRYRGRIDDSWVKRQERKKTTERFDLRVALDEVLAGKPVSEATTRAVGCPIQYELPKTAAGPVTFHRDVLPILQQNCQSCHRPGEVGPFALMTYRQAINWADDIKEYTKTRKMPPWKPSGGLAMHGERKLTDKDIATLAAWVDGGTPEGNPKDAPPPRKFADGWQLGPPDLILEPKEDTVVGAEGRDMYRCFVFPTNFPEDKFVIAYEVRPSNHRVVHHTLHFLDTQGRARRLEEREKDRPRSEKDVDRGPGYPSRMGPGFFPPSGDVGGWAPGITPNYLPEGVGYYLQKGSDFVLQVHYHRTGRVEKDRTRVGLYFAKKGTAQAIQPLIVPAFFLTVPAKRDNFAVSGSVWTAQDCTMYIITPHMHLLGKSIKVTMIPPGGTATTLVEIREWDYNWQETYHFKEPVKVKAGTKFTVEAVYDNSSKNANNPNSPPKAVWLGEQTDNEMCFGFIGATSDDGKPLGIRLSPDGPALQRPGQLPRLGGLRQPRE